MQKQPWKWKQQVQNQAGVERGGNARKDEDETKMKKSYTRRGWGGRGTGEGGWVQVRQGKNPRQGESLDKSKDKTDSTTTNKQDPQDTPAGLWIIYDVQ